ncbi:hypothetical protein FO519_002316 [Halicephalobus sp. NKZ332]|nr:hypothetical protein FO519_002316 [Halicephalobus sp. NKZ332]
MWIEVFLLVSHVTLQHLKVFDANFIEKKELKISLLVAFEDVLSTPPRGPAVITLGFHNIQEFQKFEKSFKPLIEGNLQYKNVDYNIPGSSPEIISDLKEIVSKNDEKVAVVIQGSEKVTGDALLGIHTVADKDAFPYRNSVLIFSFVDETFKGKDDRNSCSEELRKYLSNHWNSIPDSQLTPILRRVLVSTACV